MLHLAQAASQETPELLVLPLLPVACSDKAVAEVAAERVVQVVQVVPVAVALVVVVVRVAAVHTPQVPVVLVAMAGPWCWSFDHAAICRC